jgi:glycosyltransferase involved in cell wall biosynthesis
VSGRRALVCSYAFPEPDRDSGSRRLLDHLEFLCEEGWAVDFVAVNGVREGRYERELARRGIAAHDGTTTSVAELLECSFELVLFAFWQPAERYLPLIRRLSPGSRVVVDSVDLQFLRDARRTLREPEQGLLSAEYASSVVGELNVYAAADVVLTVSAKEADLINDLTSAPGLAVAVPDAESIALSTHPRAQRRGALFVGCFHHEPNVDAVAYLCREIAPLLDPALLEEHPITIVGAGLDEVVRTYAAAVPWTNAVGWVPSLTPYLERTRISVVPLRYGAGTKRKLLQTLMTGTPAVSTTVGIEGLELRHGEEVLVADDAEAFARSVTELLENAVLWRRLARKGRAAVAPLHGRGPVRARFVDAIEQALSTPPKPALLPEPDRSLYDERLIYLTNQRLVAPLREVVRRHVPPDVAVAVVSNGSSELVRLGDRRGWHFPSDDTGASTGSPTSSEQAWASLAAIRERGAGYLLLPCTAYWWRDHYGDFFRGVEERYSRVAGSDSCVLYALAEAPLGRPRAGRTPVTALERRAPGDDPVPAQPPARLIAFYLPQFHPIPENDGWWGEGFTEWTHVAKAQPLFPGHYQPHVPADLGFYDLRLPETRQAQAELARAAGIHGFCYYHYWFHGKQLLERPFDEVLASGEPDFPFCLCWANEPWSRRWHGREEDVLQPQRYSHEDDLAHIRWLLPALADSRAIRIGDRPVFAIYQAQDLAEPARTVETWRREADRQGLGELYLLTVETGWDEGWDATRLGFDAKVLFRPQFTILRNTPWLPVAGPEPLEVHDYAQAWPALAAPERLAYPHYETVCAGWDNTPRVGERGVVLHDSTPAAYGEWLGEVLERTVRRPSGERVVFVNAWNEWGEGCHLEPDERYGGGYLDATRDALIACATRGSGDELGAGPGMSRLDDELTTVAVRRSKE